MNYKHIKAYLTLATFIVFVLLTPISDAYAIDIPNFPACSNPEGQLKVKYDEGQHGIVGENRLFSGKDEVYTISGGNQLQCFCASDGGGIQTNWWKVSSLSQDQVDTLVKLGWIYVPTGASWGLEDAPYLAKNADYSCKEGEEGQVLSTSTESGIGGQVLGLATTGGNYLLFGLLTLGLALISGGLLLKRKG